MAVNIRSWASAAWALLLSSWAITKWPGRSHFTSLPILQPVEQWAPPPALSRAQVMTPQNAPGNSGDREFWSAGSAASAQGAEPVPEMPQVEQKPGWQRALSNSLLLFPARFVPLCVRVSVPLWVKPVLPPSPSWGRSPMPFPSVQPPLAAPRGSLDQPSL